MPNDAKLGLIAGLGVVVLIAAVFFRKDPSSAGTSGPSPLPQSSPVSPARSNPPVSNENTPEGPTLPPPPVLPDPPTSGV